MAMEMNLDRMDRPHPLETLSGPYGGVVPAERVIIDSFKHNSHTKHWYITDGGDLVPIERRGVSAPGVYSIDEGATKAFLI